MSSVQWSYADPQPDGRLAVDQRERFEDQEHQGWDVASSVPAPFLVLWVVIVTVTMLFAGFISAYLIRRTSSDWTPIYSPPLLLVNSAVIIASSLAFIIAQAKGRRHFAAWMLAGTVLGAAFIAGQVQVWNELAASGIFLPSSPHGSFFFMLSAAHAVHVLGGIIVLLYALRKFLRPGNAPDAVISSMAITYWHFVAGIWIVLYALMFVWD